MANCRIKNLWAIGEEIMCKNLWLIILAGIFLGCSTTAGRKYETTAIDRIEVLQHTESDVVAMVGMPLVSRKLSNGMTIYEYAYGKRCFLAGETSINLSQVQFYKGIVINKVQELNKY